MASTDPPSGLTPAQTHALFDILTHCEVYTEIEDFKIPGAINTYGPPFQTDAANSTSPILQTLVSKFALPLPGLRDISPQFWQSRVADIIQELSEAELSESYDKGILGIRKTLATAISALIEYPARGCLGGFPKREGFDEEVKNATYDVNDPDDVLRSWQDCLQALIYGDLIDEMFERTKETDDLSKQDSLVQGLHEFIIVNLASFMHYTLILSPEGPTLLRMLDSVHRLIPYVIVRQTLKIGNVASMISAMMKVVLAKVSVASVTNWMGLSSGADEGMNLLQQIISQVLNWDKRDLRSRSEKIEKGKNAPPKPVRDALQDWIQKSQRAEHEECRRMSRDQEMSIVAVILALSSGPSADDLSEEQHANAMEWLALQLAIRDRKEIIRVLCHRNPDHLTAAIYDVVNAYTPMIRQVHQAVNLSDTVWDFERFLTDMLKMSKPSGPKGQEKLPAVEDYVDLLHRHQASSHKFLHQVAKNGKEVTAWWHEYVHMAASHFRSADAIQPTSQSQASNDKDNADSNKPGNQTTPTTVPAALAQEFSKLPEDDRVAITAELNTHSAYLDALRAASAARIRAVLARERSTPLGPGAFLARWQALLDSTLLTPAKAHAAVRMGAEKRREREKEGGADDGKKREGKGASPEPPAAQRTLEVFAGNGKFKDILLAASAARDRANAGGGGS